MRLGHRVQIAMGVPHLGQSLAFYEKLGFQRVAANQEPYPWAQLTDGQNLILLNEDGMIYRGLIYFTEDVAAKVKVLESAGILFTHKTRQGDTIQQAMIFDPKHNFGINLLGYNASELYQPANEPITRCGKFGEFAIPVSDINTAYDFWNLLGFEKLGGNYDPTTGQSDGSWGPYTWAILSDGLIVLGLHETTDFTEPTLTYFAGNQAEQIASLKADGISFSKEFPDGSNAELTTPDGQKIFLFQGEI